MPRDDADDERKMTRLVVAALAMGSGISRRAEIGLDNAVHDAIEAADLLIAKLAPSPSERAVYQKRRVRFGEAFFSELAKMPGTKLDADVREAWKRAAKQVEPEFFPEMRT